MAATKNGKKDEIVARFEAVRETKNTFRFEETDVETGELLHRDDGRLKIGTLYVLKDTFTEAGVSMAVGGGLRVTLEAVEGS